MFGFVDRMWGSLTGPLYRNAFFLMATTALNNGLGFLFWIIAARYYVSSDVGLAAAAITSVGFLALLATFGFNVGLIRYLPEADRNAKAMINSTITISAFAGLLIAAIFVAGLDLWAPRLFFLRTEPILLATFVLLGAVVAIVPSIDAVLIARRRAHYVFLRSVVMGLRVPLPIALAAFFGVFGIFGSWAFAACVSAVIALLLFVPRVEPGYRPVPQLGTAVVNNLLHFSFGNYAALVIGAMPAGLLPILILNGLNAESVAYFYVTFSLAGLLYVIPGALATSLYAEGSQPIADFGRDTRRTVGMIALLLVPAILVFVVWGDVLLRLFGAEYSDAGFGLLRLLALSGVFVAVNGLYITKLRVDNRIWPIIGLMTMATALTLGISYVLLQPLGILAIGIGWMAAQGAVALYVGIEWSRRRRR